jgi:hypothetical protein
MFIFFFQSLSLAEPRLRTPELDYIARPSVSLSGERTYYYYYYHYYYWTILRR